MKPDTNFQVYPSIATREKGLESILPGLVGGGGGGGGGCAQLVSAKYKQRRQPLSAEFGKE